MPYLAHPHGASARGRPLQYVPFAKRAYVRKMAMARRFAPHDRDRRAPTRYRPVHPASGRRRRSATLRVSPSSARPLRCRDLKRGDQFHFIWLNDAICAARHSLAVRGLRRGLSLRRCLGPTAARAITAANILTCSRSTPIGAAVSPAPGVLKTGSR
jgi:hypothetical protein